MVSGRGGCSGGGGDRRIFMMRSDNAGTSWNAPVLASAAGVRSGTAAAEAGSPAEQAVEPSRPVVGLDGAVYVAYKNRDITDGTRFDPSAPIAPRNIATATTPGLSVQLSRLAFLGGPEEVGANGEIR